MQHQYMALKQMHCEQDSHRRWTFFTIGTFGDHEHHSLLYRMLAALVETGLEFGQMLTLQVEKARS